MRARVHARVYSSIREILCARTLEHPPPLPQTNIYSYMGLILESPITRELHESRRCLNFHEAIDYK